MRTALACCSELYILTARTAEGYLAPRPFRVNAGVPSSYTNMPDGTTSYLSELSAGARVLIVACDGRAREETVARVKMERRPTVLLEASSGGRSYAVLLQSAETVRLAKAGGGSVGLLELSVGDSVLLSPQAGARHAGVVVDEACVET